MNRKGKQRKSSVRRGARKELNQKEQKRLLLLGIEPCTPTANTVYIRYIYTVKPYIYGLYTVYIRPCVNPFIRIRIRIRWLQQIYGRIYMAYIYTPYISVYGSGQPYIPMIVRIRNGRSLASAIASTESFIKSVGEWM
jgi:hypothetical protein